MAAVELFLTVPRIAEFLDAQEPSLAHFEELLADLREPKPEPTPEWGIVSLMGRRILSGRISEEVKFGRMLGRVDIPKKDGSFEVHYFGDSVYSIAIMTEADIRNLLFPELADDWDDSDPYADETEPPAAEAELNEVIAEAEALEDGYAVIERILNRETASEGGTVSLAEAAREELEFREEVLGYFPDPQRPEGGAQPIMQGHAMEALPDAEN